MKTISSSGTEETPVAKNKKNNNSWVAIAIVILAIGAITWRLFSDKITLTSGGEWVTIPTRDRIVRFRLIKPEGDFSIKRHLMQKIILPDGRQTEERSMEELTGVNQNIPPYSWIAFRLKEGSSYGKIVIEPYYLERN